MNKAKKTVSSNKEKINNSNNGPIVIGGVGGSGTRVVAEILSEMGYFMGTDLNAASDNNLYTLLFKRPKWFVENRNNSKEIKIGISTFRKIMLRKEKLSSSEFVFLLRAFVSMARYGHNHFGDGKGPVWQVGRILKLIFPNKKLDSKHIGWGWKEPNTHLLLEELEENFKNFKYIYTMRNGLDMAFSENQQQLYNWGIFYNVVKPVSSDKEADASYKYWLRASERVLEIGERLGKDKFLVLNLIKKLNNRPYH